MPRHDKSTVTLYTLHSTLYTLHSTLYTLHSTIQSCQHVLVAFSPGQRSSLPISCCPLMQEFMTRNVTEEWYAGDLHHYVTCYMLHDTCCMLHIICYVYVGLLHVSLLQVLPTEDARDAHI